MTNWNSDVGIRDPPPNPVFFWRRPLWISSKQIRCNAKKQGKVKLICDIYWKESLVEFIMSWARRWIEEDEYGENAPAFLVQFAGTIYSLVQFDSPHIFWYNLLAPHILWYNLIHHIFFGTICWHHIFLVQFAPPHIFWYNLITHIFFDTIWSTRIFWNNFLHRARSSHQSLLLESFLHGFKSVLFLPF